jgi:hypothetical protein
MHPNDVKGTINTQKAYIYLEIDNGGGGLTKLSDKRDYFTFPKVTFPFVSSNIPAAPAYTVYISFIRYARVYTQYSDLLDRAQLLGKKYPIMATLLLC